jgi:hypothetical protein
MGFIFTQVGVLSFCEQYHLVADLAVVDPVFSTYINAQFRHATLVSTVSSCSPSFGGVRLGFGSVRGYGELQAGCLENGRQSFNGRIATR